MPDKLPPIVLEGTWESECAKAGVDAAALLAAAVEYRATLRAHYQQIADRTGRNINPSRRDDSIGADLMLLAIHLARRGDLDLPVEPSGRTVWVTDVGTLRRKILPPLPPTTEVYADLAGAVRFDREVPRQVIIRLTDRGLSFTAGEALNG